jgi:outer membrane protein assembly factor BamB
LKWLVFRRLWPFYFPVSRNTVMAGRTYRFVSLGLLLAGCLAGGSGRAGDWPTYRHDNQRSGVTSEKLEAPLDALWKYTARHRPRPAAPEAAKTDYWHKLTDLAARATHDRAFHVAGVGDALYFCSSADDKVYCLDAATGVERWSFMAGGPLRLAPTVYEGNIYAGSDDGWVYCLAARDGALVWKSRAAPDERQIIGNGRLISACPVRASVVVEDGLAYCCAGIFPNEAAWMWAVKVADGALAWKQKMDAPTQGYLLSSASQLYAPTGRTPPAAFRRADGKSAGAFKGIGGTEVLLSDGLLCFGPGSTGQIEAFQAETKEAVVKWNATHLVASPKAFYLQAKSDLSALDRARYLEFLDRERALGARQKAIEQRLAELKKAPDPAKTAELRKELEDNKRLLAGIPKQLQGCILWSRPCPHRHALILAGDTLFAGGENEVAAFAAADGTPRWTGQVSGGADGLAVANGRLFVSTDQGTIHCFGRARPGAAPAPPSPPAGASARLDDWLTPAAMQTARQLVEKAGVKKGFCLVLGCGDGRLLGALAKLTDLSIVALEPDPVKLAAARRALDAVGVYGARLSIHDTPPAALPGGFANLIVSGDGARSSAATKEVSRLTRPYGGVICLDPAQEPTRRGPLPNGGEWTHIYADPGNSACSGDELVGGPTQVQWFGEPGPRLMADRHHRAVPPLFKNGRLFIPAYNRIIAVDAYNGTLLWNVELPDSTRLGAAKDSGYLALADDILYAATLQECLALDVNSGAVLRRFPTPQLPGEGFNWGYTATVGDLLLGSGRKKNASLRAMGLTVIDIQYGDLQTISTSDYLFCLDRHSGQPRWTYHSGVIPDPAIAIGDGRVYFVETTNAAALQAVEGRMRLTNFLSRDTRLVALEAETGRTLWQQPADLSSLQHVIFLSYSSQTLLVVGSKNKQGAVWYELSAFDAATGRPLWHREQNNLTKPGGDHGEQTLHPAIVGGIVYAEPFAYHLRTGEPVADWKFNRDGHGCGTISGSASQLFYRAGNPVMFDLASHQARKLSVVNRPGCWINIIPAGGLVLVPEASSGCTCGFPIETTIVFAPRP